MPDFSPSLALLRRLGMKIPNNSGTPMSDDEQTTIANNAQANDTPWNKSARSILDKILGGGRGFTNGMLGKDPGYTKDASYYGNMLAQGLSVTKPLAEAGLPFMALMKDRPSPQVFHGTKKVFDAFDEVHNDVTDILGHMTHFAESPGYAESYANHGGIKSHSGNSPNIIPVKLGANNILDLSGDASNLNMDDVSQVLGSLDEYTRNKIVNNYRKSVKIDPVQAKYYLKSSLKSDLNDRNVIKKMPFDAIKYDDVNEKAFAVDPSRTKIETPWGSPMSNTGNPLRVIKSDMTSPESKLIPSDSFNSRVDPSKMYNKSKENLSASELMKKGIGSAPKITEGTTTYQKPDLSKYTQEQYQNVTDHKGNTFSVTTKYKNLLDEAEKLGIDVHKLPDYDTVQMKINDAKSKLKGPIKPTSPVSESDAMKIFEDFQAGKINHTEANTLLGHNADEYGIKYPTDMHKHYIAKNKLFLTLNK